MKNINVALYMINENNKNNTMLDIPTYATDGAAGADIQAKVDNPVIIQPGDTAMINTGIYIVIPMGYEAQVRSRSGLAAKNQVMVLNSPGTIDCDYRGEIKVILINHGKQPFTVRNKDRIAQLVFAPVVQANFQMVDTKTWKKISQTARGSGGFGSTGITKLEHRLQKHTFKQKILRFFRFNRK